MTLRIDPEQNEVRALKSIAQWRGKNVLEVGCGNGRLTLRLARLGAKITAVDPESTLIRAARKTLPERYADQVNYQVRKAEQLKYPNESFDLVVFSWVL